MNLKCRTLAAVVGIMPLFVQSANALLLTDFRKFDADTQGSFITGAVSMLAYSYAANGNTRKAHCIQEYFFGPNAKGGKELSREIAIAQSTNPERLHVEGVVLGFADKVCPPA